MSDSDSDVLQMSDSDSEDEMLISTGIENGHMFKKACKGDIDEFLNRDEYIPVRGTAVSDEELEFLEVVNDIDGVTIRWKDISKGLSLDFTHINLAPRNELDIKRVYSVIKKHLNLHEYGQLGLKSLKQTVGFEVIYAGGWTSLLCFIPKTSFREICSLKIFKDMALANIKQMRHQFQLQLIQLNLKGEAMNSLAKNNIFNPLKLFVLPGDRHTILSVLQVSLERTKLVASGFTMTFFSYRFGEKCTSTLTLPILDESGVEDICVHVGVNIRDEFHDLFWCREGVNSVIGRRGNLTSCCSFFECVNFQSNLDERGHDIKPELLAISCLPSEVRFFQLYVDIPHRRPQTLIHPVSGSVLLADGLYRQVSQKRLYQNAEEYLSEIRNNFFQMREATCRLEFVVVLPQICRTVSPSSMVSNSHLSSLLKSKAMFAPFYREKDVMGYIRETGLHLCDKLIGIYNSRRGTGDSEAVWVAYQIELAVEKLLWGNPLCRRSYRLAVNLGVGLGVPTRSLTDQKGFLCLEASSSCCINEDSVPPLEIYTMNVKVQQQIKRVFGLVNYVNAASSVLGRRVVICLLMDMHDAGRVYARFNEFLIMLKRSSGNENKRIVGGITIEDLATRLSRVNNAKWPMVYGTLKTILDRDNEKLANALIEGIRSLELGYFPAFRLYDESRNSGLFWRYTYGLYVLSDSDSKVPSWEIEAVSLQSLVLCELEKMRVCHTSQYQHKVFPWLKPCLERLAEKKLKRDEKIKVLAFVTGVALLMNGEFVDYLNFSRLERTLPVTQVMLRMLEIQCKFQLSNLNTFKVYRLHPSIPYKLYHSVKPNAKQAGAKQQEQEECKYIRDEDEIASMQTTDTSDITPEADEVNVVTSRHVPAHIGATKALWSPAEITILNEVVEKGKGSLKDRYEMYTETCRKDGIPDRTLKAFLRKYRRVSEESRQK